MTAQTWITQRDHLAYLALIYAIWGDEVRSEALRTAIRRGWSKQVFTNIYGILNLMHNFNKGALP